MGDREVNDRVAILFYEDRVDVHHRQMLRTKVGDLLESHPLEAIERPDVDKLVVAGTQWTMSEDRWKELDVRLRDHDMTIREGGET